MKNKYFITYFSLTAGFLSILIIAFTVNGASALEGKSDNLRLALRQEETIKHLRKQLKIAESIESDIVLPTLRTESVGVDDLYQETSLLVKKWEKEHPDKIVFYTLYVGETLTIPQVSNIENVTFRPAGAVIFYVKRKDK